MIRLPEGPVFDSPVDILAFPLFPTLDAPVATLNEPLCISEEPVFKDNSPEAIALDPPV